MYVNVNWLHNDTKSTLFVSMCSGVFNYEDHYSNNSIQPNSSSVQIMRTDKANRNQSKWSEDY